MLEEILNWKQTLNFDMERKLSKNQSIGEKPSIVLHNIQLCIRASTRLPLIILIEEMKFWAFKLVIDNTFKLIFPISLLLEWSLLEYRRSYKEQMCKETCDELWNVYCLQNEIGFFSTSQNQLFNKWTRSRNGFWEMAYWAIPEGNS